MRLSLLHKHAAHDDGIWCTTWIPKTSQLATGSVDESVKTWEDTADGLKSVHTYTGHTLGVVSIVVDSTGQYAASSALDSIIRIWDINNNSTKAVIECPPTETWSIAFGPTEGGDFYLAAAGGTKESVTLYRISEQADPQNPDAPTATEAQLLQLPAVTEEKHKKERFVLSVAYSPDWSKLACGAMDGTVAVYDLGTGKVLSKLEGHHKPVRSLCFTPDSQMLLTASDDMHVHLYDVAQGILVDAFSGHESWVLSVACSPDGSTFASGSSDGKVKLWELASRTCTQTCSDHTDQVWGVAFNTDGNRVATVSDDKMVMVYSHA